MSRSAPTKPIILVGTGRSGSTALHRLLARHPQASWLSTLCDRFPRKPRRNRLLMHALDLPMVGRLLERHFSPDEGYLFWQEYSRGFSKPFRDLLASDVTNREKRLIRAAMAECTTHSRSRLLLKVTGWPRISYLAECFPDARFVHLVRDGRAVANSMLAVSFWDGWRGPWRWRWGLLSDEQQAVWEETGRSFVALAGLEWVVMQAAIERARQSVTPGQFLQIRYEDLCDNKVETVQQITEFSELEWTAHFEEKVRSFRVSNTNFKWQRDLTTTQQQMLEKVEKEYLKRYGYLP